MSSTPLLEGRVGRDPLEVLRDENRRLDEALRLERNRNAAIEAGARELRLILRPLYLSLQKLYGELEMMGVADGLDRTPAAGGHDSEFWERTKRRLGGTMAQIVEVLVGHPGMTTSAVSAASHCRLTTASTLLSRLKAQNLVQKKGNLWVLNSQ